MYNDELTKKLAETAKRIMAGESVEAIEEGAEKDTKGDKEAYQKFFNDTLKKYGVKSPSELKGDDEKKFYDEIDAGWKGDDEEKNEEVSEETLEESPSTNESIQALRPNFSGYRGRQEKNKYKEGDLERIAAIEDKVKKSFKAVNTRWHGGVFGIRTKTMHMNFKPNGNLEVFNQKAQWNTRKKLFNIKLKWRNLSDKDIIANLRDFDAKIEVEYARTSELNKSEETELKEGKIDLNKKFNTSDAAFDYFHSFAVADQAKTDEEVEKSKKKFAKNTLGFWMQNLTDTLKGMGISEETELDLRFDDTLTEEEEEEIVASILDTIPDAEAAADDDNHPDEDDMLATLDTTTGYKVVDNLPEETERLDARRREFREKIRKLAYEKAKKMIKGISDADDEEEKVEGVDKPLEVQKYEAIGAVSVSHVKEEIEESTEELEEKRKSKSDYEIYHDSYTSALSEVLDLVARNGYKVDEDLWFTNVSSGPRKPSAGKTNSFTLELEKGGKPTRKVVSFQVYGLESGRYELNAYIS